jgi:hypothetical protein
VAAIAALDQASMLYRSCNVLLLCPHSLLVVDQVVLHCNCTCHVLPCTGAMVPPHLSPSVPACKILHTCCTVLLLCTHDPGNHRRVSVLHMYCCYQHLSPVPLSPRLIACMLEQLLPDRRMVQLHHCVHDIHRQGFPAWVEKKPYNQGPVRQVQARTNQ